LDWKTATGAKSYQVQVSKVSNFASVVLDKKGLTATYFTLTTPLTVNTAYYWRVRALGASGAWGKWSAVRKMNILFPAPTLQSPTGSNPALSLTPKFDWSNAGGAVSYTLVVSTQANFSAPLINVNLETSEFDLTTPLPPATPIYWRVRANGKHPGVWATSSFTSPNPPSNPALASPADGSTTISLLPTLEWVASTLPDGTTFLNYKLQVDDANDFSSPETFTITDLATNSYTFASDLAANTAYSWRIRAVNTDNQVSSWSSIWVFITPP
jgi:hypothetical protein